MSVIIKASSTEKSRDYEQTALALRDVKVESDVKYRSKRDGGGFYRKAGACEAVQEFIISRELAVGQSFEVTIPKRSLSTFYWAFKALGLKCRASITKRYSNGNISVRFWRYPDNYESPRAKMFREKRR